MTTNGKRMQNKTRRYESIVQAAEKLFLERGFDRVQMQEVADKADIGVATLFRYFPKKDRLIVAVASYNLEKHIHSFEFVVNQQTTAFERLVKIFDLLTIREDDTLTQSATFREAFESYASFSEEPLDTIEEYIETQKRIADLVMQLVDDGTEDGTFRRDIPIKEAIITAVNSYGTFGSNITLKSAITFLEEDIAPHKQQEMLKEMILSYVRNDSSPM
ncbi:TetR/AcrR family transcriptional regulator [Geomicrobium sp. JCM 19055]|uniref:TetR/AcrR family transcriptional regulator n=1 Tax=Geomicrobium sp. JCM 19055 TaxID=1460649 RepID=UPI00045ED78F|nr:TetR/AcrR family transcriptional regulator [Geomicrobium sp. JCM 19055]GAJ97913.1 transcriptional regulator, TetR family [Geomicrobium sp. JCM 19055]